MKVSMVRLVVDDRGVQAQQTANYCKSAGMMFIAEFLP